MKNALTNQWKKILYLGIFCSLFLVSCSNEPIEELTNDEVIENSVEESESNLAAKSTGWMHSGYYYINQHSPQHKRRLRNLIKYGCNTWEQKNWVYNNIGQKFDPWETKRRLNRLRNCWWEWTFEAVP